MAGKPTDVPHLQEEERVVIVRFGRDSDAACMQMDEVLASVADPMKNFAVIYLVDIVQARSMHSCLTGVFATIATQAR
jgi:U5 snRNP protein, DIM1 family